MQCDRIAPLRCLEKETLVMFHRYDVAIIGAGTAGLQSMSTPMPNRIPAGSRSRVRQRP